jgi:hypothetical protein
MIGYILYNSLKGNKLKVSYTEKADSKIPPKSQSASLETAASPTFSVQIELFLLIADFPL